MRCLDSSPLVEDCIFRDNVAENKGGGIYAENATSIVIRDCLFLANTASLGGGVDCLGPSHPRIENCHFSRNVVGGLGGAVTAEDGAEVSVLSTTLERNRGGDGGALAVSASRLTVSACSIRDNVADFGGGISCLSGTVVVIGCTLSCDTASLWGGAMHCLAGSLMTSCSTIASNHALTQAGAVNLMSSAGDFDSCEVSDNTVGESLARDSMCSGFFVQTSTLDVHRSSMYGNGMAIFADAQSGPLPRNVDATDNWWGDDSGPYHPVLNPEGLGDRVSDHVDFVPWRDMTPVQEEDVGQWARAALLSSSPNPFSAGVDLRFVLRDPAHVRLSIYNARGQLVRDLVQTHSPPGRISARWDGTAWTGRPEPPGVYFCRLETEGLVISRKIVLVR